VRKAIQHCSAHLQLSQLMIEVSRHDAFAEQLEAAHFGLNQTSSVVAAPLFPYSPLKAMRRPQDLISRLGTAAVCLLGFVFQGLAFLLVGMTAWT
jgi:hypothetical protein